MTERRAPSARGQRTTILLDDLDPDKVVRGGAGKKVFGEQAQVSEAPPESGSGGRRVPVVEGPAIKKSGRS